MLDYAQYLRIGEILRELQKWETSLSYRGFLLQLLASVHQRNRCI